MTWNYIYIYTTSYLTVQVSKGAIPPHSSPAEKLENGSRTPDICTRADDQTWRWEIPIWFQISEIQHMKQQELKSCEVATIYPSRSSHVVSENFPWWISRTTQAARNPRCRSRAPIIEGEEDEMSGRCCYFFSSHLDHLAHVVPINLKSQKSSDISTAGNDAY